MIIFGTTAGIGEDEGYSGSTYTQNAKKKGSLRVFIEPADAAVAGACWRRVGTESWRESGDWELDIPAGYYTVEFQPAESWWPPLKRKVHIGRYQKLSITVRYSNKPGKVSFRLHPTSGVKTAGAWCVDDSTWFEGSEWFDDGESVTLVPDCYTFKFRPVPGWFCPPVMVKVRRGETLNLDANYVSFLVTDCSDYDGDGAIDLSHYRTSDRTWRVADILEKKFGAKDAWPTPGDYDGDGRADFSYWSSKSRIWRVHGGPLIKNFGEPGDIPAPGDYNGDGRTDPALYRPSSGQWFISLSSEVGVIEKQFLSRPPLGYNSYDLPVPGDYDGDGAAEPAVFNLRNRTWTIEGMETVKFGILGELPAPADYNGDGKTDIAVVDIERRKWRVRNQFEIEINSKTGDIPVPGDYNGDGAAEPAFYRYKNGKWHLESGKIKFGTKEDIPLVRGR